MEHEAQEALDYPLGQSFTHAEFRVALQVPSQDITSQETVML